MIDRRALLAAAALPLAGRTAAQKTIPIDHGRPTPADRRFTSPAIEIAIARVQQHVSGTPAGRKLGRMFANCFPNTLDTTVDFTPGAHPDTFVITGDIDAMWLRDSTAQVWPYLGFMGEDPRLRQLVAGVVNRQTLCVLRDPYANAFYKDETRVSEWKTDDTDMKPGVHERKWEIDSLCNAIRLAHGYWRASDDTSPFDDRWTEASRRILRTFREQQRKDDRGPYRFQRTTAWSNDEAAGNGWGNPMRPVGLIVSMFRPSDDATIFPFLVPSNMFAVVSLRQLAAMHAAITRDAAIVDEARALADEVEAALHAHGTAEHPIRGRIWAFEVDGYGNALFIDDANVPNLVSLPYIGWCRADDPLYRRTRGFALSESNPWFHRGDAAQGIGSPHTPGNRIWPIALVMRALTSDDDAEIVAQLRMLIATDAGTGFMHEAFDADDPTRFSRTWFAWANTLFGELVLDLFARKPDLLRRL